MPVLRLSLSRPTEPFPQGNDQPCVAPEEQVVEVDLVQHVRGRVVFLCGAAQIEFGQLRFQVGQPLPGRTRQAGLAEEIGRAMPQGHLR